MTKNLELRISAGDNKKESFTPEGKVAKGYYHVEVHSAGLWEKEKEDGDKIFVGPIGIFRNITHRKELESKLIAREENLRNMNWRNK